MSDKKDPPVDTANENEGKKRLTAKEVMERALEALQLPEEEFKRRLEEFEKKREQAAEDADESDSELSEQ